jgi:hypothetical protein
LNNGRVKEGRGMKRLLLAVVATVALATAMLATDVASASAADVTIGGFGCITGSHQRTVPAGSTIVIRFGFIDFDRGVLTNLLQDQTTTSSLNEGAPIDVSGLYATPTQNPDGTWETLAFFHTGITLANPGDTMTFTLTVSLAHQFAEELNGPVAFDEGFTPGPPAFSGPGVIVNGSCTVTAV